MLFYSRIRTFLLSACFLLFSSSTLFGCSAQNDNAITVGVTSTLEDSGVLSMLLNQFEQEHGLKIKAVVAGSGHIHRLIEAGDIDTAITHDPDGEEKLLANNTITARKVIAKNDFIIVGPRSDPSHIKQSLTPDEAFEKIANTGSVFISRGDNSGTHQMEQRWRKKIRASKDASLLISTGTGMGATLTVTAERQAYTLVDRGTWLNFNNKQSLTILFEDSEFLANEYSVLTFNKTTNNSEKIALWEAWLTQGKGSTLLKNYRINGQAVFQ